jgi:hypothetical protein
MQITKAIFDQINPGEIFWIVKTRLQAVENPMEDTLTFVCVKSKEGYEGRFEWAMYWDAGHGQPFDIARYGHKVRGEENIRSLCPCNDEVFQLYRL